MWGRPKAATAKSQRPSGPESSRGTRRSALKCKEAEGSVGFKFTLGLSKNGTLGGCLDTTRFEQNCAVGPSFHGEGRMSARELNVRMQGGSVFASAKHV